MMKLVAILCVGVAAVGCSASFSREAMEQELQESRRIVFDDEDVLRISQLRPQIQYPIRLAVVPPARRRRDRLGVRSPCSRIGMRSPNRAATRCAPSGRCW